MAALTYPIILGDEHHQEKLALTDLVPFKALPGNIDEIHLKEVITVAETEISDPDSECESVDVTTESCLTSMSASPSSNVIQQTFQASRSQWIDDCIISQWRCPTHRIHGVLAEVNDLYAEWKSKTAAPFGPSTDHFWLDTGRVLAEVGLPWHNNQINMPDEIDTSWPFHFKSFEAQVLRAKGARIGDANASGYVCNPTEANLYCLRALQQELRKHVPTARPVLVYDHLDIGVIQSANAFFGLEVHQVNLSKGKDHVLHVLKDVTSDCTRPIIFAATLASRNGKYDDLSIVSEISENFPLILHVDASRNFDYITTLPESDRQRLGIETFTLGIRPISKPVRTHHGSILVSTVVAGSSSHASAAAVALKPASLGGKQGRVAYIRASDSTLAGSRDALAPLWTALHELRFGECGFREIYRHCADMRATLLQSIERKGVSVAVQPYSLDITIQGCSSGQKHRLSCLGGVLVGKDEVIMAIHPGVKPEDIDAMIATFSPIDEQIPTTTTFPSCINFLDIYPVSDSIIAYLKSTVQSWKIATRSAAGYPFHMGSYSILGPVIGCFLDIDIPRDWTDSRAAGIIDARMEAFGLLTPRERANFRGSFTNGSTMGNRIGIHTALMQFPGAFVYFSAESHYSVMKTMRDCDTLTNRWSDGSRERYHQIPCDTNGSLRVNRLAREALADREYCLQNGLEYHMVLFTNMGTTFVGARDDLKLIHERMNQVGLEISYIHVDGALDFGFDNCGIRLGLPGSSGPDGMPYVQGVTLSHHKAMGNMVSGEVLSYSPEDEVSAISSSVDPRVVFESWLYSQIYAVDDMVNMSQYCRDNASRLENGLRRTGVVTKRNTDSIITVLERPPAWIIEEFSLRPEGDWVHFITMPHISPETVDFFVARISWVERQCAVAIRYVAPLLAAVMMLPVQIKRIHCQSPFADMVVGLAGSLVPLDEKRGDGQNIAAIIKASLRGAMTVVVLDENGHLQAAFLAESLRDMSIRAGPVLIKSTYSNRGREFVDIARQLIGLMARHTYAKDQTDRNSYALYSF